MIFVIVFLVGRLLLVPDADRPPPDRHRRQQRSRPGRRSGHAPAVYRASSTYSSGGSRRRPGGLIRDVPARRGVGADRHRPRAAGADRHPSGRRGFQRGPRVPLAPGTLAGILFIGVLYDGLILIKRLPSRCAPGGGRRSGRRRRLRCPLPEDGAVAHGGSGDGAVKETGLRAGQINHIALPR